LQALAGAGRLFPGVAAAAGARRGRPHAARDTAPEFNTLYEQIMKA
jgi:hypothetical protein